LIVFAGWPRVKLRASASSSDGRPSGMEARAASGQRQALIGRAGDGGSSSDSCRNRCAAKTSRSCTISAVLRDRPSTRQGVLAPPCHGGSPGATARSLMSRSEVPVVDLRRRPPYLGACGIARPGGRNGAGGIDGQDTPRPHRLRRPIHDNAWQVGDREPLCAKSRSGGFTSATCRLSNRFSRRVCRRDAPRPVVCERDDGQLVQIERRSRRGQQDGQPPGRARARARVGGEPQDAGRGQGRAGAGEKRPRMLTQVERDSLLALGPDLAAVWHAPTRTPRARAPR